MAFSKLEKQALEVFVTSADDSIYAVKNVIPPEMFGAIGSYFSRNPKDFRTHLLDMIYANFEGEEAVKSFYEEKHGHKIDKEKSLKLVVNTSKEASPIWAIEHGLGVAQEFYEKWYGKYGHKSIGNEVWMPMVANNVSQLFARELAYEQLAFFVEQSTRFVKWDISKMHLDKDLMESKHADRFVSTIENLTSAYDQLTEHATDFYREKNKFEDWLNNQSKSTQNLPEERQINRYRKQTAAAALDVARFLLPQATQTNIAWIADARSIEFDIGAWKGHPLREIREAGELIEKHAGQIAPSLIKYTDKNNYYSDKSQSYKGDLVGSTAQTFNKGVDVISYDPNSLDNFLTFIMRKSNFGGTFSQRLNEVKKMSFGQKMAKLERILRGRSKHDERIETDEEADMVNFAAEIRTDLGAVRDWRRHQKFSRSEPLYSTENGFYMPPMIKDMAPEAEHVFWNAAEQAHEAQTEIRKTHSFQSQYVVPMATRHSLVFSGGLDQWQYTIGLRSTSQGNFSYREDAFNLAEALVRTHPWILGYKKYPKRKDFRKVYDEAPLKGFLRLDTGETALHV